MKRMIHCIFFGILFLFLCATAAFARELIPVGQVIGLELSAGTVTVAAFDDAFPAGREAGLQIGDQILSVDSTHIRCAEDIRRALNRSDGTVELAQLKDDFSGMASAPVTLFHGSDAPWARAMWNGGYVTDGPFVWRLSTGRLALLWSGFGAGGYTLGVAYSDHGVCGPWVQDPEPLFPTDGGHGMIFRTAEGKLILTLHSPNETPKERPHFFPIEERDGRLCRE